MKFLRIMAANEEIARLTTELDKTRTESASSTAAHQATLEAHAATIAALTQERDEWKAKAEDAIQRVATLEKEAVTAADRALEIAAAIGIPPLAAPVPGAHAPATGDIMATIQAIADPLQRARYIRDNIAAIRSAQASR
jgi:hypothetical protein